MSILLTTLLLAAQLQFAWLSDLHVGGATGLDDLRAAVTDIRSLPEIRFVLITGDITESGDTDDLLSARDALDSLRVPFYIIPGNHDTKWSETGTTAFPAIFGGERFIVRIDSFLLIGLHQGPRMRMADGHFAPEDLRWLDTALAAARAERLPVLVATHYPLGPGISNWFEAIDRLHRVDTRMVFVGHGHANKAQDYEGIGGAMGRSLLRNREERGGYNIVRIEGDRVEIAERTTGLSTAGPWYREKLGAPDPARPGARARPDFSVNAIYPFVRTRWQYSSGSTLLAAGAAFQDRFVVGDFGGTVRALRLSDGTLIWSSRTRGHIVSAPCAYGDDGGATRSGFPGESRNPREGKAQHSPDRGGGRVVVTSTDSSVHCFALGDGAPVWEVRTGAPVVASPAISEGVVYTGAGDGCMRAIDIRSGKELWKSTGIEGFVEARPAVGGDIVCVGAWDETLYGFRKNDGRLQWRWQGGRPGKLLSPAACWPVMTQDRVFVVAPDRIMTALEARSGKPLWRTGKHEVRESIGLAQDEARVYVRTMRDSLIAIDPRAETPTDLWTLDAGFGYDINAAMPVECEGVLFYGTMQGLLLAVDATTGVLLWKYRVGHSPLNTVTPLTREHVVCTDFDGNVTFVESDPQ
jgi:outer membrane protein assembly factor BamB/predicted phosphodiesterase